MEGWARLLPGHGIVPTVTIGGEGPLLAALRASAVDVHVHPIRVFFDRRHPLPFLREMTRLGLFMRQHRIQLVHVNEHEHYPVVARAARITRIPTVVHLRFRPDAAMCRWLFRRPLTPQRLFFTSETQMRDSRDAIAPVVPIERWRLVYDSLDFELYGRASDAGERLRAEWGLAPATLAIGTASSISRRKQLDHFIRLIAELTAAGLDVQGFIAGQPYFEEDRQELRALKALATGLGIDHRVRFLGYVEPSEPLYHAWDLCVSTSTYETFGMTVLEAMACGCPVVAYQGGSVREVMADDNVVDDNDFTGLFRVAHRLLSNAEARAEAQQRARTRARHFDLQRSVAVLVEEYRSILANRSYAAPSTADCR
jgi:glycosyltransferase involved in cell wall biosynthesis